MESSSDLNRLELFLSFLAETIPKSQTLTHFLKYTYIRVHWPAHQTVHNELTELAAIVTVDGVCQTDNHLKVVHVYVPVRMIGKQTECTWYL